MFRIRRDDRRVLNVHKWRSNDILDENGPVPFNDPELLWVASVIVRCCVTKLAHIDICAALCALHQTITDTTRRSK